MDNQQGRLPSENIRNKIRDATFTLLFLNVAGFFILFIKESRPWFPLKAKGECFYLINIPILIWKYKCNWYGDGYRT